MTTTKAKRPNFFILLGLNPDLPWNDSQFENALRAKRSEWSRQGSGIARQAIAAKQNLAFIPEIYRVMQDSDEREKEAINARAELASGIKARQELFAKRLAFITAKAFAEEAEIKKLIEDFKDILSAQEIRNRITIPIKGVSKKTTKQQLEATKAKDIADRLQQLHMETLYELLELGDRTATTALCRAAEALYSDMVRRSPTAEVTAKAELAGQAKDIFKSDEMRSRYDETLRQASLEQLLKELDAMMDGISDKKIYIQQTALFLANAQKEHWNEQEALERLEEYCRKRGWFLQTPMVDPNAQKLLCPNCKALNANTERRCTSCAMFLFINCPRCSKELSCVIILCDACHFPVGNRYPVDRLLQQEIPDHFRSDDLQRVEEMLREAEDLWPPEDKDERTRQISEYKKEVKQRLAARQKNQKDLIEMLDQLIGERKFFAAKEILTKRNGPTFLGLRPRQRDIDGKIKQVQEMIQRAKRNLPDDEKIDLCRQALVLCIDYQDAKDFFLTLSPSAPRNLRATTRGKVVNLEWEPSSTKGSTYTIVRKSGARPNSIEDGLLLSTITGLTYDDTAPLIGLPLHYAVFAVLDTLHSSKAAHLAQPALIVQNVLKFAITRVDSDLVALSWEPPPYVNTIVIVRKEQSRPNSHLDGVRLRHITLSQKTIEDGDVQNDHTYCYGIYCQFDDGSGRLHTSSGAFVEVTPKQPPTPLATDEMKIEEKLTETECEVSISWPPPQKDTKVIILKSLQPLRKEGQVLPEAQLGSLIGPQGSRLEGQANNVIDLWIDFGIAHYTPVVIFQQMGYIGASQAYAFIEDVKNLRAQNTGSVVQLEWDWPEHCEEVLISYHERHYPQHKERNAITCSLTLDDYDHMDGHYDIRADIDQTLYIVVSALVVQGNERIPARGTRIKAHLAKKTILTYEIKHSAFLGKKKRTLHITKSSFRALPTLLLISKRNGLPFDKNDGDEFHRIEDLPVITKRDLAIPLPNDTLPSGTFGKLFLEDDDWNDEIRIDHPHRDNLRLS